MKEILESADALVRAGLIAPPPTLAESMIAADELRKAGLLPEPPQPPLIDILRAAAILADAGLLPGQPATEADPAPPEDPVPARVVASQQQVAPAPTATPAPPPPPAPRAVAPKASASGWYDEAFTARVLALVNQRRAAVGLGPLASESRLNAAAAGYAKLMTDTNIFSHTGPDGSDFVSRIEAAGFPFTSQLGEVLAMGNGGWSPEGVVQAWMDSPGHREQILGASYIHAGTSCYFTPAGDLTVRCVMDLAAS
jgi:uncharacterized protein YkwD